MVFEMTRDDAANELQNQKVQGQQWSNLEIQKVESFDDKTVLVYVTYANTKNAAEASQTPIAGTTASAGDDSGSAMVEDVWAIRQESNEWLLNWKNLIDFKTLSATAQTVSGVTVLPSQLLRYTDHMEMRMLIQNRTNETVVFGQSNEILGTFYFGDTTVVAEKTQWVLNALRSTNDHTLIIKGLFTAYPDSVAIRQWKDYQVAPWYEFLLN
jgi:hypothetical protein